MITLGLLSDSHGHAETSQAATHLLVEHGADVLLHLGDVGSVGVIDALAMNHPSTGKRIEAHLVFGNTDWDARPLAQYARDLGIHVHDPAAVLSFDGQTVAITHGHQPAVMHELLGAGVDYLLHGHTHVQADQTQGKTRVINPGALFRAPRHTVALLTPATGDLEVLEVASIAQG